jgi:hypothetical protein
MLQLGSGDCAAEGGPTYPKSPKGFLTLNFLESESF